MQVTYFLNDPMFSLLLYCYIIFCIVRKRILMSNLATILPLQFNFPGKFQRFNAIDGSVKMLKQNQFSKLSIIIKNCKTFHETQTVSRLQEIIQSSPQPTPIIQNITTSLEKKILTEIYRNIQTFAFKVLQKCSSLASRNSAVQIFTLKSSRSMPAGNFLKSYYFQCQVS